MTLNEASIIRLQKSPELVLVICPGGGSRLWTDRGGTGLNYDNNLSITNKKGDTLLQGAISSIYLHEYPEVPKMLFNETISARRAGKVKTHGHSNTNT